MSLDLHTELAALRQLVLSSKDDLSRYRGAHSDACFATVLGSAEQAGVMEKAVARAAVEGDSVLTTLLASCDDEQSAMEKVAGIMCASAAAAANRVLTASVGALEQTLGPNLEARAAKLEATIDQLATKTATIVAEAEARANVVSAARADAKRTYDAQWKTIQATSVMVNGFDTRLAEIATTMARLCTDNTLQGSGMKMGL